MSHLLRVAGSVVNVRSAPTTGASVVMQVRAGELIEPRPVPSVGPWRAVWTAKGEKGWIHGAYVTEDTPAAPAKPSPAKPPKRKWRVAKSLEVLLGQINEKAPKRSKTHDGSIGDAAHASRASDHNPAVPPRADPDRTPIVLARDYTHDPERGADMQAVVDNIVASKDKRVSYIIFNRRMWRSYDRKASASRPFLAAWTPEKYTGSNPHAKHAHVSVVANPALYDDERPWKIN